VSPEPEVIAALLGVLAGVFVERFARSWGRLWCELSDWDIKFRPLIRERPEDADGVEYSVRVDLYNGKEIPVGLRDVSIVFICIGGKLVSKPEEPPVQILGAPRRATWSTEIASLGIPESGVVHVMNLPPRQWVSKDLRGRFQGRKDIRLLSRWYRVEFVGQRQRRGLFEPKIFRKIISSRPPFSDPWERKPS
jgi:hypothetical protein